MTHPIISPDKGVTRQVLAHTPEMMVVAFGFEGGAEGKLHDHHHVQSTYVKSGRFTFYVAGIEYDLKMGDCLIVPSHVTHGCLCLEAGTLIDTFSPRRDDFLS